MGGHLDRSAKRMNIQMVDGGIFHECNVVRMSEILVPPQKCFQKDLEGRTVVLLWMPHWMPIFGTFWGVSVTTIDE